MHTLNTDVMNDDVLLPLIDFFHYLGRKEKQCRMKQIDFKSVL